MKVKLNKFEDILEFQQYCDKFQEDIDVNSGKYVIDGKSYLGVLSIALCREVEVKIHTNDKAVTDKFYNGLKPGWME